MEAVTPLANDPIMLGRSIWSFKHLEHQNQSVISDSIGRVRMVQQFRRRRSLIGGVGSDQRSTVDTLSVVIYKVTMVTFPK